MTPHILPKLSTDKDYVSNTRSLAQHKLINTSNSLQHIQILQDTLSKNHQHRPCDLW